MINIQALIDSSRELLEQLQNGTHEIISRASPTTWEELRSDLETKLVPILYELYSKIGGLMQPPTIELPDGVTSTSLVSQSEMTQFVTNTLDVWLCDLMERVEKARENTIFSMQPAVVTLKVIPKVIELSFGVDFNEEFSVGASLSKVGFKPISIAMTSAFDKPTIITEKE